MLRCSGLFEGELNLTLQNGLHQLLRSEILNGLLFRSELLVHKPLLVRGHFQPRAVHHPGDDLGLEPLQELLAHTPETPGVEASTPCRHTFDDGGDDEHIPEGIPADVFSEHLLGHRCSDVELRRAVVDTALHGEAVPTEGHYISLAGQPFISGAINIDGNFTSQHRDAVIFLVDGEEGRDRHHVPEGMLGNETIIAVAGDGDRLLHSGPPCLDEPCH